MMRNKIHNVVTYYMLAQELFTKCLIPQIFP